MNKNADNRDRLIAELYDEEWSDGRTATFARQAAATARRRRAVRRTAVVVGSTLAAAAVAFLVSQRTEPPPTAVPVTPKPAPAYQVISDEELLAALHDRPVLILPDGRGGRKIVLLDQ